MPSGGCICGALRYEYTGEPAAKAACHCADCQKTTGSIFSINAIIPEENFKIISGTPSKYSKTADSGNTIVSFFCPSCGTTAWRETKKFEGKKVVKAGTLDEKADLDQVAPMMELFEENRVKWLPAFPSVSS